MVILICQFGTESNTFCSGRMELADLPDSWYPADTVVETFKGVRCYIGGALQAMEEEGVTPMPVDLLKIAAGPLMSGKAAKEAMDRICGCIRERLGQFDAIYFAMHGGGACELDEDLEGYTLRRLREVVGSDLPIFCSLDLHCNTTEEMVRLSDSLFCIKHVPHDDMYETGYKAVRCLIDTLRGRCRPVTAARTIPMLMSSAMGCTLHGPAKEAMDYFESYRKAHGLIDCTFVHGFSSMDRPCSRASVLVVADGHCPQKEADELAAWLWERRERFLPHTLDARQAIARALEVRKDGYVVINESSDNPGSGCPADGTHLLREFLRQDLPGTIMGPIYDPETAGFLQTCAPGDRVSVSVGGRTEPIAGAPLELTDVEVLWTGELTFTSRSPMNAGLEIHYGPSARLRKGNVEFMVVSEKMQVYDDVSYRTTGAPLENYRLVGLKSMNHFRSFFETHADAIVAAETPGLRPADLRCVPYRQVRRPIFPLDADAAFEG